ncbi:MAG: hypothetical protein J7501_13555 [Bdellovibrio sp.]|nr:hypothetical protein [Bdellovibrio sp.]
MRRTPQEQHRETLSEEISHIENETRMALPGIQALFGFQLVAVFNDRFATALTYNLQLLHWGAISCSALATIFMVAPAAYHRMAEPHILSKRFTHLSNRWIIFALIPMILGCVIDFFLIGTIITKDLYMAGAISAALLLIFITVWFVCPLYYRKKGPG